MMHQSLYRKYRPANFDEVADQKVIIQTLKNAIKNDTLSHAYLFAGPRGTGKTSIAKILAKMVNCESLENYNPCNKCVNCTQYNNNQAVDIIEIDAASNNGVDEIRELKSKIGLVPASGKYKIYIIDEVHMLSTGAFNALLKTLEEPPKHAIFILATTDPHKIPLTILSRCQRFDFKKLSLEQMMNRLEYVVEKENIQIEKDALEEIAYLSDGGMRDALSLLDQATAYTDTLITSSDIHEINGTITDNELKEFVNNILTNNTELIFKTIDKYNSDGKDFFKLTEEIINYLRNVMIYKNVPNYFESTKEYNLDITLDKTMSFIKVFNDALYDMKNALNVKLLFELAIIKLLNVDNNVVDNKKIVKNEIKIEENPIDNKLNLKEIRINNTLCNFNKKDYLEFKSTIDNINSISNIYSLIKKGLIKAYGNKYFIIVFDNKTDIDEFNSKLKEIDNFFLDELDKIIKGIAVDTSEWEIIKTEFNNKTKEYKFINEGE